MSKSLPVKNRRVRMALTGHSQVKRFKVYRACKRIQDFVVAAVKEKFDQAAELRERVFDLDCAKSYPITKD